MDNKIYTVVNNGKLNTVIYNLAPANCLSFDNSEISNLDYPSVIFFGCMYYGLDVARGNSLIEIAHQYPSVKFYFRLTETEEEVKRAIPQYIVYHHLPVLLFKNENHVRLISSGRNTLEEVKLKLSLLLNNK